MPGSALSVAQPNIMLNTVIADALQEYADILENAEDFDTTLHQLIQETLRNHKRIIFNGNGYDDSWIEEAKARGLLNLKQPLTRSLTASCQKISNSLNAKAS